MTYVKHDLCNLWLADIWMTFQTAFAKMQTHLTFRIIVLLFHFKSFHFFVSHSPTHWSKLTMSSMRVFSVFVINHLSRLPRCFSKLLSADDNYAFGCVRCRFNPENTSNTSRSQTQIEINCGMILFKDRSSKTASFFWTDARWTTFWRLNWKFRSDPRDEGNVLKEFTEV